MSRSLLIGAAAFAAVALVPHTPAMAQDDASITVRAPQSPRVSQPKNTVHPQRQLVAQVSVPTYDLDWRTAYGRYVLDNRVRAAADQVCDRLDAIDSGVGLSGPTTESLDCRAKAARTARAETRWAAG
jgi:hypothetical protein